MAYSFLNVAGALTIFLLILLAFLLITSSKSTTSARILSVFLLLHALLIAGEIIDNSEFVMGRPGLAFWTVGIPLLFGPLLWLYANSILFRDFYYRKKLLWHFVPFLISLVALIVLYQIKGYNEQVRIIQTVRDLPRQSDTWNVYTLVVFTHTWIYLIFSFGRIRFYRNELTHQYSSNETIHVNWLISMLSIYGILSLGIIANSIFGFSSYPLLAELSITGFIFVILIYFTSIYYRALTFPNFFPGIPQQSVEADIEMSKGTSEKVMVAIDKVVFDKALYTRAYFTLQDLEEITDQPAAVIIHVLRSEKEMTFNEYINRMRVELARRLLIDPGSRQASELEIMYDCGFNTFSSFHKAFKLYTGKNPSEVREQHKVMPTKSV